MKKVPNFLHGCLRKLVFQTSGVSKSWKVTQSLIYLLESYNHKNRAISNNLQRGYVKLAGSKLGTFRVVEMDMMPAFGSKMTNSVRAESSQHMT